MMLTTKMVPSELELVNPRAQRLQIQNVIGSKNSEAENRQFLQYLLKVISMDEVGIIAIIISV